MPTSDERARAWFSIADGRDALRQGDVLLNVPVEPDESPMDLIVLAQSCDLEPRSGKQPVISVLLAPCLSLAEFLEARPRYFRSSTLETIRNGYMPGYYVLPPCLISQEARMQMTRVVEFTAMFTIPFEEVWGWVTSGMRQAALNSPFREHLGQAIARFFMRVGLPIDVARFAFKPGQAVAKRGFEQGSCLWQDGPALRVAVEIEISEESNAESGDKVYGARAKTTGRVLPAIGCGPTEERALTSLTKDLAVHVADGSADGDMDPKFAWVRETFRIPERDPTPPSQP